MAAVDNDIYNREADTWRDERHLLAMLVPLTPPRVAYIRDVLTGKLGIELAGKLVLEVGCGGGLLTEEMAKIGCRVTGVDPSGPSLETARRHAEEVGLDIDYREAHGESLPFEGGSFDIVYCCDVLEHVNDVDAVIRESARVLKPGGVYIFDTINRTLVSKLIVIKLAQEWSFTRFFTPNFHVWERFITPEEMRGYLAAHGLALGEFAGLAVTGNPLAQLRLIRKLKRGRATYGEVGKALTKGIKLGKSLQASYFGYASKPA